MQDSNHAEIEGNKRTVRALYEDVLSNGRVALLRELLAPQLTSATDIEDVAGELRTAFPDIQYVIEDLLAEGARVAVRWHWTGTHRAPFRGFPASGKAMTNRGLAVYTLQGGLITGVVLETDRLGFLQQLGVVPPDATLQASATAPAIDVGRAPTGVH